MLQMTNTFGTNINAIKRVLKLISWHPDIFTKILNHTLSISDDYLFFPR